MNELDLYYRALLTYRKALEGDAAHRRFLQASKKALSQNDRLEAVRSRCVIDEQWVAKIEWCLPFIEKAIGEDRQFIRQEGETVPIEKAKKVSKLSVTHLAKHSDYITHLPENENDPLLPDRIYISENESNYAVYENRFLYMLLCYARDFVEMRYSKISELGNTYKGVLKLNKHVEIAKRTVVLDLSLQDVSKNDKRLSEDSHGADIIERLEAIRIQISSLLLTPLMCEVSKAPMIRPPVTRTNVLRMNNNFRNAVTLYDYLSSYEGAGYTIEEIKNSYSPLTDGMDDEVFEIIPMLTYLVYKYGNRLSEELEASYEHAEAQAALELAEKEAKELASLQARLSDGSITAEEYILRMQTYTRDLEESVALMQEEQKNGEKRVLYLMSEIDGYKEMETRLKAGIGQLQEKNAEIQSTLEGERATVTSRLDAMQKQCDAEVASAEHGCQQKIEQLAAQHLAEKTELTSRLAEYEKVIEQMKASQLGLQARLHAYQGRCGEEPDESLTEEENFERLEMERAWFESMFKKTWKQTKKRIRRDLLWSRFKGKETKK